MKKKIAMRGELKGEKEGKKDKRMEAREKGRKRKEQENKRKERKEGHRKERGKTTVMRNKGEGTEGVLCFFASLLFLPIHSAYLLLISLRKFLKSRTSSSLPGERMPNVS